MTESTPCGPTDPACQCSLCYEDFVTPKMISCGHTFCMRCLQKLPTRCLPGKKTLTCPTCRSTVMLPLSGIVEDFPTNFAILNVVESNLRQNICSRHQLHQDLFCKSCSKLICSNCFEEYHLITSDGSNHDVRSASSQAKDVVQELQSLGNALQESELVNFPCVVQAALTEQYENYQSVTEIVKQREKDVKSEIDQHADVLMGLVSEMMENSEGKTTGKNVDEPQLKEHHDATSGTGQALSIESKFREVAERLHLPKWKDFLDGIPTILTEYLESDYGFIIAFINNRREYVKSNIETHAQVLLKVIQVMMEDKRLKLEKLKEESENWEKVKRVQDIASCVEEIRRTGLQQFTQQRSTDLIVMAKNLNDAKGKANEEKEIITHAFQRLTELRTFILYREIHSNNFNLGWIEESQPALDVQENQ